MKRITFFFALSLSACGSTEGPVDSTHTDAVARLRGRAVALKPVANERVQVIRLKDGVDSGVLVETQTDGRGDFEVDVPATGDPVRVDVGVSLAVPTVSVLVVGLTPGATHAADANVFTRLSATLAAQRIRARSRPADMAHRESIELIDGHFGRIPHHRVQPAPSADAPAPSESGISAWLMLGLVEQASELGVSLSELVDRYNHDLSADGVFDGRGRSGALSMGARAMDGDGLRGQYALALERVLVARGVETSGFAEHLVRIRTNTSEIFPRGVVIEPTAPDAGPADLGEIDPPADLEGPALELELLDVNGSAVTAGSAVRGVARVRARAEDPSGVRSSKLEAIAADGARVTLSGDQLDTALLGNQSFRLVFQAEDAPGNVSNLEASYRADNQAPSVTLAHPAVVGASPASVRLQVEDDDRVERVTLMVNGANAAALRTPAAESSVAVAIVCPGTSLLEATVYDRAGNSAFTETAIVCEDRGPEVVLHAASWRQEGNVTATYRADGRTIDYTTTQPVLASFEDASTDELVIERYWPRLHEALVGRADLPRLRFEIWDRSGAGVQVEVRHETAAGPGTWFQPASAGDALFEVPIGYEQLGATLLEQHRGTQAIVIRATDAFGVVNERVVSFRLALRSPPLWLGGCSIVGSAMDPATVTERLRTGAASDVGSFSTRYVTGLPSGSPISAPSVAVSAASAGALVEITGVGVVRFDGAFTDRSSAGGPGYLSCGWVAAGIGSPYQNYRCQGVRPDGTWAWLQNPSSGASRTTALPPAESLQLLSSPLNQPTPSATALSFFSGAQSIPPTAGATFQLPADEDLEAYVSMLPSPIRIQGQTWNWPTQPGLLNNSFSPAVSYGRAYWLPTLGVELGAYGRNLSCTPNQRIGTGVGGPDVPPACSWQERGVQTVSRLSRLVVRSPVPTLSASLPALGLSVPVQRAAECGTEWRYELDLTML